MNQPMAISDDKDVDEGVDEGVDKGVEESTEEVSSFATRIFRHFIIIGNSVQDQPGAPRKLQKTVVVRKHCSDGSLITRSVLLREDDDGTNDVDVYESAAKFYNGKCAECVCFAGHYRCACMMAVPKDHPRYSMLEMVQIAECLFSRTNPRITITNEHHRLVCYVEAANHIHMGPWYQPTPEGPNQYVICVHSRLTKGIRLEYPTSTGYQVPGEGHIDNVNAGDDAEVAALLPRVDDLHRLGLYIDFPGNRLV